jgi:hypothetical protein
MAPRVLVAGLVALAAAGCGGRGEPATKPAPQQTPEEAAAADRPVDEAGAIEALLSDRARALEQGDAAAFAGTATGEQRSRDRSAAQRTERLSLERVRFVADEIETSGDRARLAVTMSYRVRGMSRAFLTARRMITRKTSAGWRVSRDIARREPLPWEIASFTVTHVPHVVLLTPPGVDVAPLRSGLAAAYGEIRRELPARDLPRSVLVIGARDAPQAGRLAGRIAGGVVALANVSVEFGPAPALEVEHVLSQRMLVITSRWSALPERERQATLVHEMTHTALDPDTSGRTPPWLAEGVAMYVSGDDRAQEARLRAAGAAESIPLRRLCKPDSIFKLNGREQGAAYAASSGAAEAIVARYGTRGLFRLYDAFNDSTIEGPTCAATTDRVLRRTLDMSLAELDATVAAG